MSVARGTTPTFTLTFSDPDLDLTEASNVYVTFSSKGSSFTKTGVALSVTAKSISVFLSQKETLSLCGNVRIQANWLMPGGARMASDIVEYALSEQLLEKVIE